MGFTPTRFSRMLYARNLFAGFSERFSRRGDTRIAPNASRASHELATDFSVNDAMVADFRQYLEGLKVKIDEDAWKKDQNFIRAMMRFEIDLDLFGVEAAWQNVVKLDPQVQYGLGLFPEAQTLLDSSHQAAATRRAAATQR
jgi:carboxyl-terminal processing protease